MHRRTFLATGAAVAAVATTPLRASAPASVEDVMAVERAFARTMADRDFEAFASFIDEEAEFLNGGRPLHGKAEVLAFWKKQYEGAKAPFSWAPDRAVVVASGTLANTEGPVSDAQGHSTSRFYSTWRRNAAGEWKVVFDNGYDTCPA